MRNFERFSTTKQMPIYVARIEKGEVMDHIVMDRERKITCCSSHKSPKRKPTRPGSGNFQYPYTFLERRNQKKSMDSKYEQQPKIAIDGTEHTVLTTENENLHRRLLSTPLNFQR